MECPQCQSTEVHARQEGKFPQWFVCTCGECGHNWDDVENQMPLKPRRKFDARKVIDRLMNEGKEKVESAALRFPSGNVYTDMIHFYCYQQAIEAGEFPGFTSVDDIFDSKNLDKLNDVKFEEGFMTDHGRFLSREEAFKLAKKSKQVPRGRVPACSDDPEGCKPWLDSTDIEESEEDDEVRDLANVISRKTQLRRLMQSLGLKLDMEVSTPLHYVRERAKVEVYSTSVTWSDKHATKHRIVASFTPITVNIRAEIFEGGGDMFVDVQPRSVTRAGELLEFLLQKLPGMDWQELMAWAIDHSYFYYISPRLIQ